MEGRYKSMVWHSVIWALVTCVFFGLAIGSGIVANNNDHGFDTACISAGKSVVYKDLEGYVVKECK